jgi:hydroxymethylpyrimidine/phosphomethylpyrimidine kinase
MLAITAVTAQDARGVRAVAPQPVRVVRAQLDAVLGGVGAHAVAVGMLANAAIVAAVAAALARHRAPHVVLDPVLRSTSGGELLDEAGRLALLGRLLPLAALVTPNLAEAGALLGRPVRGLRGMAAAAAGLRALGARAVLVKGGHLRGDAVDLLDDGTRVLLLRGPRIATPNTRGTGCVLAAAIASRLARGETLVRAVRGAKAFVARAIRASYPLGAGAGPVDPFAGAFRSAPGARR